MAQVIIDSGSTKADWCIIDSQQNIRSFQTEGYNPYFISEVEIIDSIGRHVKPLIPEVPIDVVYFYGAGCAAAHRKHQVSGALSECFPKAAIFVETDLLGSARAALGREAGFTAILGTGTNTGIYDGSIITRSIDSAGYFLGDEGSGAYLGKLLVRSWLRKSFHPVLHEKFSNYCSCSREEILDRLYNKPFPNRFLAGFARFAAENIGDEEIGNLVRISFEDFIKNIVMLYDEHRNFKLHVTGSIGFVFKDELEMICRKWNVQPGTVVQSPMDGLTRYHLSNLQ